MADPNPHFTPASARVALRDVRPVAERLCRVYRAMEQLGSRAAAPDERVDPAYFLLVVELHGALDNLASLGVQVKDLRSGLCDFPSRRDGRPVLLCWRVGEETLGFWHDPEAGVAGRRPVDEDGPWDDPLADPFGLP